MTVNFEYTDHLESIHPSMSVMVKYSVMADVKKTKRGIYSVELASIKGKVCSLLSEGEYENLDIPKPGMNREINKLLGLFNSLAADKYDSEIKQRNQTA